MVRAIVRKASDAARASSNVYLVEFHREIDAGVVDEEDVGHVEALGARRPPPREPDEGQKRNRVLLDGGIDDDAGAPPASIGRFPPPATESDGYAIPSAGDPAPDRWGTCCAARQKSKLRTACALFRRSGRGSSPGDEAADVAVAVERSSAPSSSGAIVSSPRRPGPAANSLIRACIDPLQVAEQGAVGSGSRGRWKWRKPFCSRCAAMNRGRHQQHGVTRVGEPEALCFVRGSRSDRCVTASAEPDEGHRARMRLT